MGLVEERERGKRRGREKRRRERKGREEKRDETSKVREIEGFGGYEFLDVIRVCLCLFFGFWEEGEMRKEHRS